MPSRFQEMLKNQRQNPETGRAGLKWDTEEENQLLSLVANGQSVADIAKSLQRTEGSIRTRLIMYAINKMENDNLSLQQVCEMVHLSESEVIDYQQKKQAREDRFKQKKTFKAQQLKRPANITNTDIYDLILSMNRNLESVLNRL